MNKFAYYAFLNVPVKCVMLGLVGLIFLMSLVDNSDKNQAKILETTKEVSISCYTRPDTTGEKDSFGNDKYVCKARQ